MTEIFKFCLKKHKTWLETFIFVLWRPQSYLTNPFHHLKCKHKLWISTTCVQILKAKFYIQLFITTYINNANYLKISSNNKMQHGVFVPLPKMLPVSHKPEERITQELYTFSCFLPRDGFTFAVCLWLFGQYLTFSSHLIALTHKTTKKLEYTIITNQ